jgi:lipopolysaccharide/colanic/teichoic acid biosynthesis glycosyltransferase
MEKMTLFAARSSGATPSYFAMKRAFDIFGSALGLVVLSPLVACVAVAVKLDSRGPMLYKGARVGINGQQFNILKFRTMVANAEAIGGSTTPEDDPRVTAVGRFLRTNKLDELPQLWNVLIGEMSFVGPRPQVQWAVDLYTPEERLVLSVRPGITDYASLRFANEGEILKGSKDPDRDYMEKIHPEKMRLSLEYVRSRSFSGDLSIIAQTLGAVIRPLRN